MASPAVVYTTAGLLLHSPPMILTRDVILAEIAKGRLAIEPLAPEQIGPASIGLTIEHADAEGAVVRMDVPDALMSPFGAVHGGFIAALLDTGFGIALHRRLDAADRIATHTLNVTYVAFSREQ